MRSETYFVFVSLIVASKFAFFGPKDKESKLRPPGGPGLDDFTSEISFQKKNGVRSKNENKKSLKTAKSKLGNKTFQRKVFDLENTFESISSSSHLDDSDEDLALPRRKHFTSMTDINRKGRDGSSAAVQFSKETYQHSSDTDSCDNFGDLNLENDTDSEEERSKEGNAYLEVARSPMSMDQLIDAVCRGDVNHGNLSVYGDECFLLSD